MSGRIRTIKPELLEDEKIAGLTHEAFRLFIAMILMADDHGNLRANMKQLDAAVFWSRDTREGIASVLREITELPEGVPGSPLVTLYTVHGQSYAHLNGWSKHQRIDKPSLPKVPTPKDADPLISKDNVSTRETLANESRQRSETLDPRARAQDWDLEGNGKGEGGDSTPPPVTLKIPDGKRAAEILCDNSGGLIDPTAGPDELTRLGTICRHTTPEPIDETALALVGEAVAAGKALGWRKSDRVSIAFLVTDDGRRLREALVDAKAWAGAT